MKANVTADYCNIQQCSDPNKHVYCLYPVNNYKKNFFLIMEELEYLIINYLLTSRMIKHLKNVLLTIGS